MQHKTIGGSQHEEDMLGLHASEETTRISKKAALQQYREYLIQGSRKVSYATMVSFAVLRSNVF